MTDDQNPETMDVYLCDEGHIHIDICDGQGMTVIDFAIPVENAAMLCDRIRETIRQYGERMKDTPPAHKRHLH